MYSRVIVDDALDDIVRYQNIIKGVNHSSLVNNVHSLLVDVGIRYSVLLYKIDKDVPLDVTDDPREWDGLSSSTMSVWVDKISSVLLDVRTPYAKVSSDTADIVVRARDFAVGDSKTVLDGITCNGTLSWRRIEAAVRFLRLLSMVKVYEWMDPGDDMETMLYLREHLPLTVK